MLKEALSMINLFGSNALLGTSFNDVFSIVFFLANKIFKTLNVQKKFLVLFVTTYFSTFEEQ